MKSSEDERLGAIRRRRKNHNGRKNAAGQGRGARTSRRGRGKRQPRRARTSEECTRCARLRSITGRAPPAPPPRVLTVRARVGATDTHAPSVTRATRLRVHGQAARSPIDGAPAERRWRPRFCIDFAPFAIFSTRTRRTFRVAEFETIYRRQYRVRARSDAFRTVNVDASYMDMKFQFKSELSGRRLVVDLPTLTNRVRSRIEK